MWPHNFLAAGLVEQLPNFFFLLLGVVERRSGYEVHSGLKVIMQPKLAMSPYFFCFRIQSEGDTGVCYPPNFPSHFFIILWGGTLGAIWLWSLAPLLPLWKFFCRGVFMLTSAPPHCCQYDIIYSGCHVHWTLLPLQYPFWHGDCQFSQGGPRGAGLTLVLYD